MSNNNSTFLAYAIALGLVVALVLVWNFVFKRRRMSMDQAEKAIVWVGIFVAVVLTLYFEFFN